MLIADPFWFGLSMLDDPSHPFRATTVPPVCDADHKLGVHTRRPRPTVGVGPFEIPHSRVRPLETAEARGSSSEPERKQKEPEWGGHDPDTPWDWHILLHWGGARGVNVGIYGIHGVSG